MTSGKTLSSLHASYALLCIAREFCREWTVTCNEHVLRRAPWHFDFSSRLRRHLSYHFETGFCWGSGACRCKISTCKPSPLVQAPSTVHVLVRGLLAELFEHAASRRLACTSYSPAVWFAGIPRCGLPAPSQQVDHKLGAAVGIGFRSSCWSCGTSVVLLWLMASQK